MPLLFFYQVNSFSNGHKYSLQRNSLPVATTLACSGDQWIDSYHKMIFVYNSRNLIVNYADVMRKNCIKEATVY